MLRVYPIARALVPVDSEAAAAIADRNYDEFQGDHEIFERLQTHPHSILGVTMSHCVAESLNDIIEDGSEEALKRSSAQMATLIESPLTKVVENALWIYEIVSPNRPGIRQIGLGCMVDTAEIRTEETPNGTIIRNEGIREKKAEGRAKLVDATQSYIGVVNNTFVDTGNLASKALEAIADNRPPDFECTDEKGVLHRSWMVTDPVVIGGLQGLMASIPCAYVADGNHRSAAAAQLGREQFLNVLFPSDRMGLASYNRLVRELPIEEDELLRRLIGDFEITRSDEAPELSHHRIGLYVGGHWYVLEAMAHTYDPDNAVENIDADIVQRCLFQRILGIKDPRSNQLNFVGGDRSVDYLVSRVDSGEFAFAVVMAPVAMEQIIDVCEQDRFMPPKSTWFEPKIRIGLCISLF